MECERYCIYCGDMGPYYSWEDNRGHDDDCPMIQPGECVSAYDIVLELTRLEELTKDVTWVVKGGNDEVGV